MDKQQNKPVASSPSVQVGMLQGWVQGDYNTVYMSFQPDAIQNQKNRQDFLGYLRTRYHSVLEQSLQGATLISLGLQARPEAIVDPARLVFRHLNQSERVLPPGTSITEAYDQAGRQLLILGEPGAGKSTLLLHLAQDLLIRAERDDQHPLPVILNLSSWAQKCRPLEEWLVEALLVSCEGVVSRKVGKHWAQTGQILLLLDGLDELDASALGSCIGAIHDYRRDHPVPLVVCSRTTEYFSQQHRLKIQGSVEIQPLSTEQINDYLQAAGPSLAAVQTALQTNQVLRDLAVSPLILNVLMLTYRDASAYALPTHGSMEEQQRQVFASYIKRMLPANETIQLTSSQRMLSQLIWLARQMQQHSQTIFYLEQLQPSWLQSDRLVQVYERWAICLPGMLIGTLVSLAIWVSFFTPSFGSLILYLLLGGLLGGILSQESALCQPAEERRKTCRPFWQLFLQWLGIGGGIGALIGLSNRVSNELTVGLSLCFGLSGILLRTLLRTDSLGDASSTIVQASRGFPWQRLIKRAEIYNGALAALLVGLSMGLSNSLSIGRSAGLSNGLRTGLGIGLSYVLSFGLIGGLLSVLLIGKSPEIQTADHLVWSRRSLRKSLFLIQHIGATLWSFVLVGLIGGLSVGLSGWLSMGLSDWLSVAPSAGLSLGLSLGLNYWLLLGLFQGVSSETIEDQQRIIPNQGVHRSLSNGILLGLASTIIAGLIGFLSTGLIYGLIYGLSRGLSRGLSWGLSNGLSHGVSWGLSNGPIMGLSRRPQTIPSSTPAAEWYNSTPDESHPPVC